MKVLMFGWEFPPFISGGLGTACYGITKGISHHGVETTFVLPTKKGKDLKTNIRMIAADELLFSGEFERVVGKMTVDRMIESNLKFDVSPYFTETYYNEVYKRLQTTASKLKDKDKISLLDFTGNYGKNLMAEVSGLAIIGEYLGLVESFDVIHAHDWLTVLAGVAAKQASGKPLVMHVHATEFDRSGESVNQQVYDIEKYGMDNADKIIAVSHLTKNIIVTRYGQNPDKVDVVHNAVEKSKTFDKSSVTRPLKEKTVLFLGRVTMQKGPDYFIEAAHLVLQKLKDVRFVMAGSGDMLNRIINRMAYLKIADRFHFTGFLKGQQVEKIYAMSDLYIMPSVSEPFGIAPFEALLYDVPVIISKQSGVAEVLKNAVMVDFWDVHKLADRIVRILTDDSYAAECVKNCKADFENVAWETAGYKIRQVYESVVK
ncbi:MAG: glycosyltransferase family 4 protein [Fibrobacteres bacterium]|nr:glycosyltransferase family 4 protein [Fibrobacterota bacterium]